MLFHRNLKSKKNKQAQTQVHPSNSLHPIDDLEKTVKNDLRKSSRLYRRRVLLPRICCVLAFFISTRMIWYNYQSRVPTALIDWSNADEYFYLPQHQTRQNNHAYEHSPTNHACDGYEGIYHIEKGDIGGAAGTIFFQFVIGQIMWAEKYNFKPWIHFNNISHIVFDPVIHGNKTGVDFTMQRGMSISYVRRPMGHRRDAVPGPPIGDEKDLTRYHYHFDGDGVWNNYFEPISDFAPGDKSCENKPLITMDLYLVTPGVHGFSGAPRCWRYDYLPDYITKPHIPLNDWLAPQRKSAHDVLKRYIRLLPHIEEQVEDVNPNCSIENSCLGLHIRHSDKAAGRRVIETDEFLPYVESFLAAGGRWVYLATDSEKVVEHIKQKWPRNVLRIVRSMGDNIVRSNDLQAVFDIDSHHRTNTEILVEISALAKCQFIIHGLSAVTESSIWINIDLHYTSVNLEDPQHMNTDEFQNLVGRVLGGEDASEIAKEKESVDWWIPQSNHLQQSPKNVKSCDSARAILHISHVGLYDGTGSAFFTSILNQLLYAERNHLMPWIHLSSEAKLIYDDDVHGEDVSVIEKNPDTVSIRLSKSAHNDSVVYPGPPIESDEQNHQSKVITVRGNGIWTSYFHPVSAFVPGDNFCEGKSIITMNSSMVQSLNSFSPFSSKAWQYDDIPNDLWNPNHLTLKSWLKRMRVKASEVVKKYFEFQPFIADRAQEVNPVESTSLPCLAVHLRNVDKEGVHREKFPPNKFRDYLVAFARAGGKAIYIASDSQRSLEYVIEHFPPEIREMIRTQGSFVVRSSWKLPPHMLEKHHRVNSEALVDVLAMSKCQFLLHGNSAISEAAIYLNMNLHHQSVNLEDPDRLSPMQFYSLVERVFRRSGGEALTTANPKKDSNFQKTTVEKNVKVIHGNQNHKCKRNAIVYLGQKSHSSYDRNSFDVLLESLEVMNSNYLSLNNHQNNTDVIIFHTADFTKNDMDLIEQKLGSSFREALSFVDLYNTSYWQRPSWHSRDNPDEWYAYPLFSEGYRQMMHWYAIDIWRFFQDYGESSGCSYEYVMRFDEDSFLRSPIDYDVFDFMKAHDYNYGFRLCSYEMQVTKRMWKIWRRTKGSPSPIRDIDLNMCGIYNNFFVAKLAFFQSDEVQRFLKVVDRQGMIYRRRLGDLMIHSMSVYAFSPPESIHRFLDFTYEHSTVNTTTGCVVWGGIQAGYNDPNANTTLENYLQKKVSGVDGCVADVSFMSSGDLSPTYQHLPDHLMNGEMQLKTIMAGKVELPGQGLLSG